MINIFDLGANKGQSTDYFSEIMNQLKIDDYMIYDFEPYSEHYEYINKKYKNNNKVICLNLAISNSNKKEKIYIASTNLGHSIFPDKHNIVNVNNFIEINSILFSDWFNKNINKKDINIVLINIEGAEYYFFNDIIDNNIKQNILLFYGSIEDPKKIKSLKPHLQNFYKKINDNNIIMYSKADIEIIKSKILNGIKIS